MIQVELGKDSVNNRSVNKVSRKLLTSAGVAIVISIGLACAAEAQQTSGSLASGNAQGDAALSDSNFKSSDSNSKRGEFECPDGMCISGEECLTCQPEREPTELLWIPTIGFGIYAWRKVRKQKLAAAQSEPAQPKTDHT